MFERLSTLIYLQVTHSARAFAGGAGLRAGQRGEYVIHGSEARRAVDSPDCRRAEAGLRLRRGRASGMNETIAEPSASASASTTTSRRHLSHPKRAAEAQTTVSQSQGRASARERAREQSAWHSLFTFRQRCRRGSLNPKPDRTIGNRI